MAHPCFAGGFAGQAWAAGRTGIEFCGPIAALRSYGYDAVGRLRGGACWVWRFQDLPHCVVERRAEHLHVEVYGVAGQVAFGPVPVPVFENDPVVLFHFQVPASAIV